MPTSTEHDTTAAAETEAVAARLAQDLTAGDIVLVSGDLGAGKTTFVRGACRALGVSGAVTSPSFTIARRYEGTVPVSHLDLYRLGDVGDEDPALLADELGEDRVAFVEWPEVGARSGWIRARRRARAPRAPRRRPPARVRRDIVIVLGFDTATAATVVALLDSADAGFGGERRHVPAAGERPGHGSRLLTLAHELLEAAGLVFADVDRIAVGLGPGGFTGLRIAVATARALAQGADAELVGVSTLHALAVAAEPARAGRARGRRRPPRRGLRRRLARRRAAAGGGRARPVAHGRPAAAGLAGGGGRGGTLPRRPGSAGCMVPPDGSPQHGVSSRGDLPAGRGRAHGSPRDLVVPDYMRKPDAVPGSKP